MTAHNFPRSPATSVPCVVGDPYAIDLSRIDDCIAHLVALRSTPKYWTHEWLATVEAFGRLLRSDALEGEIEEAREALTVCEDCHKINCICDVRFEERRNDGWHGVTM